MLRPLYRYVCCGAILFLTQAFADASVLVPDVKRIPNPALGASFG